MSIKKWLNKKLATVDLFSWIEDVGYIPRMDIAMPPLEIGFIYLELSNDIESYYAKSQSHLLPTGTQKEGCLNVSK